MTRARHAAASDAIKKGTDRSEGFLRPDRDYVVANESVFDERAAAQA